MAWIRTITKAEAHKKLLKAMEAQRELYPKEYADPVHPDPSGASSVVGSHTLIPETLHHAFATFGAIMSPGVTPEPAAARDDRHHGLGDQPLRVLNRVARRVSAQGHTE